jgi:hypothetical protein
MWKEHISIDTVSTCVSFHWTVPLISIYLANISRETSLRISFYTFVISFAKFYCLHLKNCARICVHVLEMVNQPFYLMLNFFNFLTIGLLCKISMKIRFENSKYFRFVHKVVGTFGDTTHIRQSLLTVAFIKICFLQCTVRQCWLLTHSFYFYFHTFVFNLPLYFPYRWILVLDYVEVG